MTFGDTVVGRFPPEVYSHIGPIIYRHVNATKSYLHLARFAGKFVFILKKNCYQVSYFFHKNIII